ncbi:DUF6344 domain-containing protein [Streptomyces paromomycinus]|uniref:Uncharacterized protein n=1 Tax=Streptomyces paromomycinus TaxID=92743 RepID=A0A401W5M4_STREY|nr:DUF6344 domain-containing protein [Streptomyces paromomycinus]GCD44606.1 hypothetical protein GKJPGBOP_04306 [Streptomyces paromomycinus]
MAATKVTKLWTAFLVVIVKFLAALGFRAPAAASSVAFATIPAPAEGETHGTAAALAAAGAERATGAREVTAPPGSRKPAASDAPESPDTGRDFGYPGTAPLFAAPRTMYGRTLPPTMKQRIRAEAHGAAPSSRCVQSDAFDAPYAAPYPAPYSAPVGAPPARAAAVPSPRGAVPAARRPERVLCPA